MGERISDDELRRLMGEATPGPWRLGADLTTINTAYGGNADFVKGGWAKAIAKTTLPKWMPPKQAWPNGQLIALAPALAAEVLQLREALAEIANITERKENKYPADWREQIVACPECQRYKNHPIQQGICDDHRKPIYAQQDHDAHETRILGYRAQNIARAALSPAPVVDAVKQGDA